MKLEDRFMRLFNGLERAYGIYELNGAVNTKGKAGGKARTTLGSVHPGLWVSHLAGKVGLGVVPIRDDAKCEFSAVDVDVYNLDVEALSRRIHDLKLPLVLCRSKSGGAHLYMFTQEPESCAAVRAVLMNFAVMLDFPTSEIFPKQSELESSVDVGNWINMPYFDADRTTRYAIINGKALSTIEFLDYAESHKTTLKEASAIQLEDDELLRECPPCLQVLTRNGIPEGGRNEVLFNLGVYARKAHGEDWQQYFDKYNQKYMNPPLDYREVASMAKQVGKKEYFYKCNNPPLCNYCNKDMCLTREFGIGDGKNDDPGIMIDYLTQILCEPPLWIVSVNGHRLQMQTDELMSQTKFHSRCINAMRIYPSQLRQHKWRALLQNVLNKADVVEAPEDAGPIGQLKYLLEQFCTTKAQARTREELLMGKPWSENGKTYFRSNDFFKYLEQQKFRDFHANKIFAVMREHYDVGHEQFKMKGKCVRCWSVPEFVQQDDEFEVTRIPMSEF